jgi:CheY-like chemotaxis protein
MNDAAHQNNVAASPPWSAHALQGMSGGERIVVVDDHPELADTLASVLTLDGFNVRTAADGASALTVIEEHKPICVLADIDMPGMNGFELVKQLRQRHGSDIVLIAITGWGEKNDCLKPEFDVFDHCLRKPIDLKELRKVLSAG